MTNKLSHKTKRKNKMFKQLMIIFSIVSVLSVVSFAQEKPETEKKESQECSKDSKCCSMKGKETSSLTGESSAVAFNKVCPVKGEEIDADAPTVEYNGKLIGFCCPGCDSKFQKDPEKYMKNLNEDGSKFIGS
jgi:YHS domain-containing protein